MRKVSVTASASGSGKSTVSRARTQADVEAFFRAAGAP
jgi:hypothetical protein